MSPSRIGILGQHGQHGNPNWKPWVISSVGIICTFILLFSWYMILRRLSCTLGSARFLRNPNQRRTLPNDANPDDPSLQFHSHGLDTSVVGSLPITQFKKKNEAGQTQSNTDCAVCLGEFEEGEWLRHLPNCTHAFHTCCIDSWFVAHSNCPLCRSEVYDFGMDHDHECPVPMHTPLETLRESHYQIIRSAILGTSPLGREARQAI